jgi:hypothetical protein
MGTGYGTQADIRVAGRRPSTPVDRAVRLLDPSITPAPSLLHAMLENGGNATRQSTPGGEHVTADHEALHDAAADDADHASAGMALGVTGA